MPIDSSIYGLIRAPQQGPGPLDMYAKGVQLSSMIDEQGLNQLKRKQVEQAMADEAATGEAYRLSGGDPVKLADILRGRGLYKPAMAAEKAALDARNTRATAGKTEAEALAKNVATLRDALVGVNDQAGYDAWREVAARLVGPDLVRSAPPQFTPEWKTQNLMKADDLIKRLSPELKMTDTGGAIVPLNPYTGAQQPGTAAIAKTNTPGELLVDTRTREEGAANRGVTIRGQNMTDARARDLATATREATASGRIPPGYRMRADGSGLEAIPGGPADEKAGEAGRKREAREGNARSRADLVIGKIDEALGQTGFFSTGLTGETLGKVPGTGAYDLEKTIDTIKANIGFQELQAMREASPTGGALGQVAVQELTMLQSVLASLDKGQSEAQLRSNLAKAKKHFENWKKTLDKGQGASGGWKIEKE